MGARPDRTARVSRTRQIGGARVQRSPFAPIDLISRIQRIEGDLSAAKRRVAAAVAADYEATTRMAISDLAGRAGVSQPSVTRFCRAVGCTSFSEFKVLLATTLTVAAVYLRTDRVFDDDVGQLAQVVMLRASNAIRDCLEKLDTVAVKHAIAAIAQCNRLDVYGQGERVCEHRGGRQTEILSARTASLRLCRRSPAAHVGGDAAAEGCRLRGLEQRPV